VLLSNIMYIVYDKLYENVIYQKLNLTQLIYRLVEIVKINYIIIQYTYY